MARRIDFRSWIVTTVGWLFLLLAVIGTGSIAETTKSLHFERIGGVSGPLPEVITALYQDRSGFLWIGSRTGLFLYDGYSFTVFEHDPTNPSSISDNTIRIIYEDGQGRMWFGTNTGGLNRLDRTTWQFEHYRHNSLDPSSLSHDSVYSILQDDAERLWVGTQQGLNKLDPATGKFERFLSDPGDSHTLSHDYIFTIFEDRDQRLWISTIGGGLNQRDPATGKFISYRHDPDDPNTLSSDNVFEMIQDDTGTIWVTSQQGLNGLDPETGVVRRIADDPEQQPGLSKSVLTSVALGPPGELWVGTHGEGLTRLDTNTGTYRTWRHDPTDGYSLSNDRVVALIADDAGALWVGTWGGGLNRLTQSSVLLSTSAEHARMPDNIDEDVTALMYDSKGGLWIGTRSGDVVRRNTARMTDQHFLRGGSSGTSRTILNFAEDQRGQIWVATSGGMLLLGTAPGLEKSFYHDPADPESIGPGYVRALLVDHQGDLWIGSGEGGLQRLDAEGKVIERFLHDPDDPGSLSDNYITSMLEGRDKTFWVGTRSGGVNLFDRKTGHAIRYLPDPDLEGGLNHHYVLSIVEDSRGTVWIGTGGGGLNRVDPLPEGGLRFTPFTEARGLSDDDVMGVLEDDIGALWLSTKSGLTRLDTEQGLSTNLFLADGLPSEEFEPLAVTRSKDTLYFGSVKGMVSVPADTPFPDPLPSPTIIRSIRNAEGDLPGDRPAWELKNLDVPWGDWLSLELAVLDFGNEHKHRYRYRLGGEEMDWVDLGSRREITFTRLDPGIHEFSVHGRNSQGKWTLATPILQINVIPPLWMTTWFRVLALLLVVGLVVTGHRVRVATLRRRNRELIRLHEQREKARQDLDQAYERLRRLARRLEAAKEEERAHIARELHDEMGPTLTAVIINLQLLTDIEDPVSKSQRITDTIDLVDRMIQKIRDLSLDLRPPLLDELGLLPALNGHVETQARRAKIKFKLSGSAEGLPSELEITAFRLVQEAVTNVIRHAEASRISVKVEQRNGLLGLLIKDDGRGFNLEDASARAAAGTALGLLGMQERVRLLGGEIVIDSKLGTGTVIRIELPLEERP